MKAVAAFSILVLSGLLFGPPAAAAPICRWVDDSGRTHLADIVPERYMATAKCSDSSQYEIDPDRVHKAQQQARELRQRADLGNEQSPAQAAAASAASPVPANKTAPTLRPARGVDASTDCATWRQLYNESGACFGPYRTVGGGVKSEAFDKCRPIPSPDLKCGPASN